MGYKCSICGSNDVDSPGGICELCAIGEDPFANAVLGGQTASGASAPNKRRIPIQQDEDAADVGYVPRHGGKRKMLVGGNGQMTNTDPYGNSMTEYDTGTSQVAVHRPGEVPDIVTNDMGSSSDDSSAVQSGGPITSGITKNISVDEEKKSALVKWFRTLFKGVPFALDNNITMFQVFPDFSSTSLNAQGNACDQVIVYGKLNSGAISENNDVEVYGHRDSDNNIIATMVRNTATGTSVRPTRVINVAVIWVITVLFLAAAVAAVAFLGVEGLIWAGVIILLLTNLPLVLKIVGAIFGILFSILRRVLR